MPVLASVMARAPAATSFAPDAPFKRIGGHVALDLVNTCDWRGDEPANERLTDYDRLVEWSVGAELVTRAEGARLRRNAGAGASRAARTALDRARWCRWVLRGTFVAAMQREEDAGVLAELEALARQALDRGTLAWHDGEVHWRWPPDDAALDRMLWPVVHAAARLLGSDDVRSLRQCDAEDCGWIYLDHSRNGQRRWCEMSVCGTREKNRRRAERKRAHA
jgi:predicted RNA-binding Zn ribbon-like protein